MHEMGIMSGILDASIDAANKAGHNRIIEIQLTIGELTEIQGFALDFAFEALSRDTIAEGGELKITFVEPRSKCNTCGHEYDHDRFTMVCPECNSFDVMLLQGREMQIDSIEAETVKKEDE